MTLLGETPRIDCKLVSEPLGLTPDLYNLTCGPNHEGTISDPEAGRFYVWQRGREAAIINEKLESQSDDALAYGDDSVVILDCPHAYGGVCVLSDPNGSSLIDLTTFTSSPMGQWMAINPVFFGEIQGSNLAEEKREEWGRHPVHDEVLQTMNMIRDSRDFFDFLNLYKKSEHTSIVYEGINAFLDLIDYVSNSPIIL